MKSLKLIIAFSVTILAGQSLFAMVATIETAAKPIIDKAWGKIYDNIHARLTTEGLITKCEKNLKSHSEKHRVAAVVGLGVAAIKDRDRRSSCVNILNDASKDSSPLVRIAIMHALREIIKKTSRERTQTSVNASAKKLNTKIARALRAESLKVSTIENQFAKLDGMEDTLKAGLCESCTIC